MYRKIDYRDDVNSVTLNSIVACYYSSDKTASTGLTRATAEHYQLTGYDQATGKFELSIPDDEIPDGPIYMNGKPITGILDNPPAQYISIKEMVDQSNWYLLNK